MTSMASMSVLKGLRALRVSESLDVRGVRSADGSQAVVVDDRAHFSGSVMVDAGVRESFGASDLDAALLVDIVANCSLRGWCKDGGFPFERCDPRGSDGGSRLKFLKASKNLCRDKVSSSSEYMRQD